MKKRERIRIKNKYKKIKENMKGGVCGEYVDDVRTYRRPMTAMEGKGHFFWSFISIIPPFSFPAFLTSLWVICSTYQSQICTVYS